MKSVKFIIKDSSIGKDGLTPIYLQYNYNRAKRTLLNTGKYISPKYWNKEGGKLKKSHLEYTSYYNHIESLRRKLEYIIDNAIVKGIDPTINYVKKYYNQNISFKEPEQKVDLFDQLDKYIEESKSRVTADVIKDYKAMKKHLLGFQKKQNIEITYETINYDIYQKLITYLTYDALKPDKTKGLATNTVGKQIKNLKAFLRDSIKREIISFKDLSFLKVPTEEVDSIYLNDDEINLIKNLDLSDRMDLITYRDLFIIGCETGLRYSDFSNIKPANIKGDYIRKKMQKGNRTVIIPISDNLRYILEKYNYKPPTGIAIDKFNGNIKEIGMLAGITEEILTVKKHGNKKEESISEKYKLISSHTCRRSFCTNQFSKGMPTLLIRKISGHRTETSFLKYIKINEEEAAKKMLELWRKISLKENTQYDK